MSGFVHLHVHSDFSLTDAAVSVAALADGAKKLGQTHIALTDHGNMFGAMEFAAACKGKVKPIIGCEAYVAPGSRHEKQGAESENKFYHLVLLASSEQGYRNLVKLCSFAYTEGFYYRPRVDTELLQQYHEGIIALSACVSGEIPRLIQAGKTDEAEKKAAEYRDLFGYDKSGEPCFYIEMQNHGIPAGAMRGAGVSEWQVYRKAAEIAKKTGVPIVATNDVHYAAKEDSVAHDVLLCIGTGKFRTEEKRKKYYGEEYYLKSEDEMRKLFAEYPEAIDNTVKIAERCVFDIPQVKTKDLPRYLPDFAIPPDRFPGENFSGADEYLRRLTADGLEKRYPGVPKEIRERADYELDVIIKMNFTGYFLIVADFINWAKDNGIDVGPGRGSGAGSIVAYALRITDLDPLKYDLLFERFLNPERISMPDFDVDFCNERREEVIQYVTEKYGRDQVGQIITFGTLGAKAVIKDVARVLGISIPESNMITKLIPSDPKISLKRAFETEPKLAELEADPRYTELFGLARKLEGLHRHASLHAAGVVIGKTALHDYVPLYRDPKTGGVATGFSMNYLEGCGLVKMDFLGLKTLDVIRHTEELIHKRGGAFASFSIKDISETDREVFAMLGEGKSACVFQFESPGMQKTLIEAKPTSIEDLIALNALYRPGPMDNIPRFIESKHGRREITYPDPSLEEILKETYGVIVYQEQVMQVARIIAGFTLGHADELRRAMGKKNMDKMVKEKEQFISGAVGRGYSAQTADRIFELLVPFAGYGFNKSHAAAYAFLAYQTAWLKAHFPAEFMAANLTNEINSPDKLPQYIDEARRMGLEIDPPDVNRSDKYFTVESGRIVYGFMGIKGIGEGPAEEILEKRAEGGPFKSFMDFLDRVTLQTNQAGQHRIVSRKVIELLIKTGAFSSFGKNRATLLANMEMAAEYAQNKKDDGKFGQANLFGDEGAGMLEFTFAEVPEMERMEQLGIEKDLIGFYFSGHPLDEYKDLWKSSVNLDLSKPEERGSGPCMVMGLVKEAKTINSKSGKMAYVTLEDYNGEMEITFFSRVWEKAQAVVLPDRVACVKGKLEFNNGRWNILAEEAFRPEDAEKARKEEESRLAPLEEYKAAWKAEVKINLSRAEKADPKETYLLIGILSGLRPFHTQKGNDMAYAALSDWNGEIGVTLFPKAWTALQNKLEDGMVAALRGKIKNDSYKNKPAFYPDEMMNLPRLKSLHKNDDPDAPAASALSPAEAAREKEAAEAGPRELHIRLKENAAGDDRALQPLRNFLLENPGKSAVFIHVPGNNGSSGKETVIKTASGLSVNAGGERLAALEACEAVAKVWGE